MLNVKDIRLFLFDMDGTLYLGDQLYPFTKELLATIRAQGKRYLFMTNNSSKSVGDYVKKLAHLGIEADGGDFITSAQATVHYLKTNHPDLRFYVGGTKSLLAEFAAAGLDVTDERKGKIDAVVLGFDTELTFRKLDDLSRLLRADIPYIATHPDYVCPTEYGAVPDCGAVTEMLWYATGRRPVVVGKPEPLMPRLAMEREGVAPEQTLVCGDRLYTDIECGIRAGCKSLLVFSGETTREQYEAAERKPTFAAESCAQLLAALKAL